MKLDLPNAKQQRALSVQLLPQDVSIPVGNLMWRFVRIRLTDMKTVIYVNVSYLNDVSFELNQF
ncbi:hypothetical protein T11_4971 [Trichinella zimbabwensis]|uniref:Uncharacterized protein n=1 Tax=Trichinella zimbabwensis TaxID=268475 RepID=A0A0V1HIE7_9BILA|nr:hypothetical protein T11_4971 [Trichinella zimbabwensis]